MSHKIIKPEGIELIEYLNNGYAICDLQSVWSRHEANRRSEDWMRNLYLSIVRIKDGRRGLRV